MGTDGISVGDWVVAGRGEDLDVGRIVSLNCGKDTMESGDAIGGEVAWEWSQTRTSCPIGAQNDVHVYGTREAALAEAERRRQVRS